MAAPFTVTIDDRQVRAALTSLARQVADMKPAMEDIGRALGNLTEDAFQAEGPGWPQLSAVTVARRGNAHPILQVSAAGLAASITQGGDARRAWVGASKVYAAVHQFGQKKGASGRTRRGAPIPWGDIPPRPYLPIDESGALTPAARDEVLDIIREHLRQAIR
jgi:phage virion morphogenesis protein